MSLRLAATAVVLALAACSAVVDPDDMRLPCVRGSDGWDPCPIGLACEDSYCVRQTCTPGEELCNGLDDDCDGVVDNGHDLDEDGFTWCGGGELERADCDDSQAAAHPGDAERGVAPVAETCDGLDNDCNGMVDDGDLCSAGKVCIDRHCINPNDCTLLGNECPFGQVCDTARDPPTCVAGDDCRMGATCTPPQMCDRITGNCVTLRGIGDPCATDMECNEGYCALRGALGLSGEGRICAKACCMDSQCPAGSFCYAPGNGAKLCTRADVVGRQPGGGAAGSSCGADDECASGFCEAGMCLGNCSRHAECGGRSCTLTRRDSDTVITTACGSTSGGDTESDCSRGEDCRFGLCYVLPGGFGLCSGPCGTSADCPSGWYCGWDDFEGYDVQHCVPSNPFYGNTAAGGSCGSNTDCRDLGCVGGTCWATCCSDDTCGGGACKAVTFGSSFQMHCEPG